MYIQYKYFEVGRKQPRCDTPIERENLVVSLAAPRLAHPLLVLFPMVAVVVSAKLQPRIKKIY